MADSSALGRQGDITDVVGTLRRAAFAFAFALLSFSFGLSRSILPGPSSKTGQGRVGSSVNHLTLKAAEWIVDRQWQARGRYIAAGRIADDVVLLSKCMCARRRGTTTAQ